MIVLKIIGWIILALIALLLLLLCLPVTLGLSGQSEAKFDIWVRFAGVRVWRKKDKAPQEAEPDQPKAQKKKTDFSQTVKTVVQLLRLILDRLPRFLGKLKVRKLHLVCIAADEDAADAALEYGAVCGVLYPLIDYIRQNMRLNERNTDVEIRCDFDREKPMFEIETEISMSVGHIVIFALRVLSKKIMEDITDE